MAITDTARKAEQLGTSVFNITLNSTAAGSLIVVGVSAWAASVPTVTVSDNVNGAYSSAIVTNNGSAKAQLFYRANNAGGNLIITVVRSPSADSWAAAHEFAGVATSSPLSGIGSSLTGSSLINATGSFTPPDTNVLLCAVTDHSQTVTAWTINQAGQGFTLSNQALAAETGCQPGCFVFKIVSGAPGSVNHSWTVTGNSGSWAACIHAFKPAAAAGAASMVFAPPVRRFQHMIVR